MTDHFRALERMYLSAPANEYYRPRIEIAEARASIEVDVAEKFFHAAGAVHGSVYFKVLDDAAYFAANSLETERCVVTTSFTTYLTRPISSGVLRAEGRVVNRTKSQFIAEAIAYNSEGREVGRGSGIFVRSGWLLAEVPGFAT